MERTLGVVIGLAIGITITLLTKDINAGEPLVVKDGRTLCGEWIAMLESNPNETVIFTGTDQFLQKIKLLVDPRTQDWRIVVLSGVDDPSMEEDPMFACEIDHGQGFMSR